MLRASDRQLRVIAPLIAREARTNPHPILDELMDELAAVCGRRGLRSILADMERISSGGDVELPRVELQGRYQIVA